MLTRVFKTRVIRALQQLRAVGDLECARPLAQLELLRPSAEGLAEKVANARKYGGNKGRDGRVGSPVTRHESLDRLMTVIRPSLDGLLTSCASSTPAAGRLGGQWAM